MKELREAGVSGPQSEIREDVVDERVGARVWRLCYVAFGLVVAALLVFSGWVLVSITNPPAVTPKPADSIVVFAGDDARIATALELMDRDLAPVVVINRGIDDNTGEPWPSHPVCTDDSREYDVECIIVEGDSTRAEARAYAALAEENGWASLILVTADFHLARATLLLDRCFSGEIQPVASPFDADRVDIRFEFEKLTHARLLARAC